MKLNKKKIRRSLIHAAISCTILIWISGTTLAFYRNYSKNYHAIMIRLIDYTCPSFENFQTFITNDPSITEYNTEKYIKYFEIVAKQFPKKNALTIAGCFYAISGRLTRSEKAFHLDLKEDPNFFWTHYNLGLIYFKQKKYQQAIDAMQLALSKQPESTASKILSSEAYMQVLHKPPTIKVNNLLLQSINAAQFKAQYIIAASLYLNEEFEKTFHFTSLALKHNTSNNSQLAYWRTLAIAKNKSITALEEKTYNPLFLKQLQSTPFQFF